MTPEQAAELILPTDSLAVPLGPGVPGQFMHALGGGREWEQLDIFGALLPDLYEIFVRPGVRYRSGFYGPAERFLIAANANLEFVPADFRRFAPVLEAISPRVMATAATPPDDEGWMSLSLHAGASVAELRRAAADPGRLCIVETSPNFPRTLGLGEHRHALHVDEVDVVVEGDASPFVLVEPPATDVERSIAEFAARYVVDGATLQTGIGGIPNTVAALLAEGTGSGYGIHSEMFTTGLMKLCQAGKVTNDHKGEFDGFSVSTFAAGTVELYEWLDGNETVRFLPVDIVNSPENISRNREMITINGAMSIDMHGQVVADTVAGSQFSGIGGHEDFVAGTGLQLGDRSLLCMPSTATVEGEPISRIVPSLVPGAVVTTPRHQVDVVITEFGAAELQGRTVRERAEALVEVAHPDFRQELAAAI